MHVDLMIMLKAARISAVREAGRVGRLKKRNKNKNTVYYTVLYIKSVK